MKMQGVEIIFTCTFLNSAVDVQLVGSFFL